MASHFLITIDVEGDNVWAKPKQAETGNAAYMPRFQALCEKYGLRPTYLTNHEMAMSPVYREFAQDVAKRNVGEIGMHLHAWDTPPFEPLTGDDSQHQPYLIDYPESTIRKKVRVMTDILESMVGTKMLSHRAGRWAFNAPYARALVECGYVADCSVTPNVSWRSRPGAPSGAGGSDYTHAPAWEPAREPRSIACCRLSNGCDRTAGISTRCWRSFAPSGTRRQLISNSCCIPPS
jgi:hypothetical protein